MPCRYRRLDRVYSGIPVILYLFSSLLFFTSDSLDSQMIETPTVGSMHIFFVYLRPVYKKLKRLNYLQVSLQHMRSIGAFERL